MSLEATFALPSAALADLSLLLSSTGLADLFLPSSVVAASSVASSVVPSAGVSPSAGASSSVFSGSTKIVGGAIVAITKSLSVIVGVTFSGSLTDDILRLLLISVLSKSTTI